MDINPQTGVVVDSRRRGHRYRNLQWASTLTKSLGSSCLARSLASGLLCARNTNLRSKKGKFRRNECTHRGGQQAQAYGGDKCGTAMHGQAQCQLVLHGCFEKAFG